MWKRKENELDHEKGVRDGGVRVGRFLLNEAPAILLFYELFSM